MPYTTIVAGTYTSASWANSDVRDQVVSTFTTSAARDAAITSPVEGMHAYLTTPAAGEYAGTGVYVSPITGMLTVYNGTKWVAVQPISAYTNTAGTTTQTTFSQTLTGGGTNPSVTTVTGTVALVTLSAEIFSTGGGAAMWMSVDVSGASTVSAINQLGITATTAAATVTGSTYSRTFIITGLTAGANTFTLSYKVGSNTGNFANRGITVVGVL